MAHIIPFRGYRFNPSVIGDLSDVVTPPYDRVDRDIQDACYERNPHNIVRIIKGRTEDGDREGSNVYSRAAEFFHDWMAQSVLIRDAEPGFYAYHQTYSFDGQRLTRKGIVALGKLEPEKVHAHEKTLKGPKEDRLRLMRATEANFGHIFMLYDDPARTTETVLRATVEHDAPLMTAKDLDGNDHRVWRITDGAMIRKIQEALEDKDLYIADGHHRYETAVNFMNECVQHAWKPAAPESFDVRMMTLFNVSEPGMSIRPIHRLVHGIAGFEPKKFLQQAAAHFHVQTHATLDDMMAATRAGRAKHTFGFVTSGSFATLQLKDERLVDTLVESERSEDYRRLDVTILHAALLDGLLGIDARALEEESNVTYTVDAGKGAALVQSGKEQMLFYLNATSAGEVIRVANHNEKMPQKSTDFYPKLLTGLVLSKMEITK